MIFMQKYLAETQQQQSTNTYYKIVVDITTELIISAAPVIISAMAAWLFLHFKSQIKLLINKFEDLSHQASNTPEFTPQEEESIRELLRDLTKLGFNRTTLFLLEQVRKKNDRIYATSFCAWFEHCAVNRLQSKETKHIYSIVSTEINYMVEGKQKYVYYDDYQKGKIYKNWMKKRFTKSYFLYLINEKYTGFLLLEKTRCYIGCPVNLQKVLAISEEIATLVNS
jgi:hypothetical protein